MRQRLHASRVRAGMQHGMVIVVAVAFEPPLNLQQLTFELSMTMTV